MSKKKAAATMSLKDFHGGSIPSDLPLPSAPGVTVRPSSDRSTPTNWGNKDLRPRPKSSGAAYSLDEKASFLSHPAPIGRNFDEDERKPLDGVSASRTFSDESIRGSAPVHQVSKMDYAFSPRTPDRLVSSPVTQSPALGTGPSPARIHGGAPVMVNSQNSSSNSGQVVQYSKALSSNYSHNPPNAWAVRKEVMSSGEGHDAGYLSVSPSANAVSKLSHASAIEKVSSGLWQSKNPSHLLPQLMHSKDSGVIHELDAGSQWRDYNASRKSQAESVWVAEDGKQGRQRELLGSGSGQSPMYAEEVRAGAGSVRPQLPSIVPPEMSEESKTKLLPRSESSAMESAENSKIQGYQQAVNAGKMEIARESYKNSNPLKPGTAGSKTDSRPVEKAAERPKLNLKPRTQLLDQTDGSLERERSTLFGGARPREVVLKERGVDDVTINNLDVSLLPDRVNSPKNEVASEHLVANARHVQKFEDQASNRQIGRDSENKDKRVDPEKANAEKRNWRNENWRSSRDAKDQRHEPETWRKPIEEPKPASPDPSGIRHGKLVSALELAQAFSKSVSSPKSPDPHSAQRGLPDQNNQVAFSRLTDEVYSASTASARH